MTGQYIDREDLKERTKRREAIQDMCKHEFQALDPGPYSDDIVYIVCKKCEFQKL